MALDAAFPSFLNPAAVNPSGVNANSARSDLSRDEFMKILVAELTNQNPLEPLKNSEYLGQLAQLEQMSASAQIADGIKTLVSAQGLGSASSFIGKYVRGVNDDGDPITGKVERVRMEGGKLTIVTDGGTLLLTQVTEVLDPALVAQTEDF